MPPKMIPMKNQKSLVVIIQEATGEILHQTTSRSVPPVLRDRFCFGSMVSVFNREDPMQDFFCLSTEQYDKLVLDFSDGLELDVENSNSHIDEVLKKYSNDMYSSVSMDKIVPTKSPELHGFHNYVRIFAGDGSPPVDTSFSKVRSNSTMSVYYKITDAREYNEYSPLSSGFFNSSTHGLSIQKQFIPLIERALGKKGMYSGGRCVMSHRGNLSYVGPRKNGTMR
jgi:hypothetical protein